MINIADDFRNQLVTELRMHEHSEPILSKFVETLEELDCLTLRPPSGGALPVTVTNYLSFTLERIGCSAALANAVKQLAHTIDWYQIFRGEGIEPSLARGLVAGQMAGQVGVVDSSSIRTGLFLLAPDVHYPLHQHAAQEIYFVVSGRLTLQHGRSGSPFQLDPGQWSVTPRNRVHALTTCDDPCLLIYAWIGEVEALNWWWEQDANATWSRICWERQPDARWIRTTDEPITSEILKDAGEV